MSGKRIVFSTNTPNDQGFRIPNDVLKFERFVKNPVILKQHKWEELPLGKMTDIKYDNGEWTGVPVFHRLTADSIEYADLWQAGFLNACSIGGFKELKTTGKMVRDAQGNQFPEVFLDKDGLGVATLFDVYEISMVSIPSNMDAVQKESMLAAKSYDEINIQALDKELTTLSSKIQNMETEAEKATRLAAEAEQLKKSEEAAKLAAGKKADDLPTPIAGAVAAEEAKHKSGLGSLFEGLAKLFGGEMDKPKVQVLEAPAPENLYKVEDSKQADSRLFDKLKEKVGTMSAVDKAKKEKAEKLEAAKAKATELLADALAAKEKADKLEATQEDKDEFAAKKKEAEEAVELCTKMESDDDDMDGMGGKKEEEKLSAKKIKIKTMDELKADQVKLAAKPNLGTSAVMLNSLPKTMSKLAASDGGKKLIERVTNRYEGTEPSEYAAYMNAMRNEPKFKPVFDKTRIILGANEGNYKTYRTSARSNPGYGVDEMISRLASGNVNWLNRNGSLQQATTLTATDDFLASPDLFAMDFLDLAIFKLFPTTSWKDSIPIFGADTTENNTGLIWANIAANPTIYMGTQPTNPANYTYSDTPVALNLTPFWMNPMLWTPLTMAQLRYDQMGTGWAQAFAVMGTYIDDYLLYTLGSAVPHASIVYSSGISPNPNGGNTSVQTFTLNGNADDPNSFYYVPTFAGTLNNPTLNDIIRIEQVYNKQNYELQNESAVVVMDPTTDALIAQTSQSQSLLTRWTEDNGRDQLGFKHTRFNQRSRVIAFDPTTDQVKSPFSIIPSTATSANLGFIPSQVGIGIGNLDVFMIQDPGSYGYKMSADVRMGITPLRQNGNGVVIFTYGPQIIS